MQLNRTFIKFNNSLTVLYVYSAYICLIKLKQTAMQNFRELNHVTDKATETTVNLFNTCRPILKDSKGKYIEKAVKPYKNGVIVEKEYL